ncbi:hypothetical protein J6590_082166 [Homalodisca vitripennis]|nr:hypothetical protein J6590_082166 [Homalodisca vitripennis]
MALASEEVEHLAIELYGEFNKITEECDPLMFNNVFKLLTNMLQSFDKSVIENKSLQETLSLLDLEKEDILSSLNETKKNCSKKDEKIWKLQEEVDILRLDSKEKIWKNEIERISKQRANAEEQLIQEKKKLENILEENKLKEMKCQNLEHLYSELMLDHRNLIEVTKLLEEDLKSLSNTHKENHLDESGKTFCEVIRKGKHINTKSLNEWPTLPNTSITLSNKYDILSGLITDEPLQNQTEINTLNSDYKNESKLKQKRPIIKSKTYTKQETIKNSFIPKKIQIFADSHGKNLYDAVQPLVPDSEVFVNACPGAPITHILQNTNAMCTDLTDQDVVVIIGGANDMSRVTYRNRRAAQVIPGQIHRFCQQKNHTNFIFVPLFQRHDLEKKHFINKEIAILNGKLEEMESFNVIDGTELRGQHFTRHGMHLNKMGKKLLGRKIVQAIGRTSATSKSDPDLCGEIPTQEQTTSPSVIEVSPRISLESTLEEQSISAVFQQTSPVKLTTDPTVTESLQTPPPGHSTSPHLSGDNGTCLQSPTQVKHSSFSISSPFQGFETPKTDKRVVSQQLVDECKRNIT